MRHEGIDAVVITRPSNIRYVTGYDLPSHEVPAA
ncbi:MAG: aminopeptidase P family N-terminal domain-containing protein, partial [Candidatus Thorarchaeota archaeon]